MQTLIFLRFSRLVFLCVSLLITSDLLAGFSYQLNYSYSSSRCLSPGAPTVYYLDSTVELTEADMVAACISTIGNGCSHYDTPSSSSTGAFCRGNDGQLWNHYVNLTPISECPDGQGHHPDTGECQPFCEEKEGETITLSIQTSPEQEAIGDEIDVDGCLYTVDPLPMPNADPDFGYYCLNDSGSTVCYYTLTGTGDGSSTDTPSVDAFGGPMTSPKTFNSGTDTSTVTTTDPDGFETTTIDQDLTVNTDGTADFTETVTTETTDNTTQETTSVTSITTTSTSSDGRDVTLTETVRDDSGTVVSETVTTSNDSSDDIPGYASVGSCGSPPICSGDPINCAILSEQHLARCAMEEGDTVSGEKINQDFDGFTTDLTAEEGSILTDEDGVLTEFDEGEDVSSDFQTQVLDRTSPLGSGSCPTPADVTTSFGSRQFDYSHICNGLSQANPLFLLLAFVFAARIVYRGLV